MLKGSNQKGFTLVEVVAAIVIITIILISFMTFFLNAAKTTRLSNDIFDATYYAQEEMERLYQMTTNPLTILEGETREEAIDKEILGLYTTETERYIKGNDVFERAIYEEGTNKKTQYIYELKYEKGRVEGTTSFIIKVREVNNEKSQLYWEIKAQMQSVYEWRES